MAPAVQLDTSMEIGLLNHVLRHGKAQRRFLTCTRRRQTHCTELCPRGFFWSDHMAAAVADPADGMRTNAAKLQRDTKAAKGTGMVVLPMCPSIPRSCLTQAASAGPDSVLAPLWDGLPSPGVSLQLGENDIL